MCIYIYIYSKCKKHIKLLHEFILPPRWRSMNVGIAPWHFSRIAVLPEITTGYRKKNNKVSSPYQCYLGPELSNDG